MVAFDRPHGMTPPQAQWELPFFDAHHRSLADSLARSLLAPIELPVGVVTALIGGPFFLWLLSTGGRR